MIKHIPYTGGIGIFADINLKVAGNPRWGSHYEVPIKLESSGTHNGIRIVIDDVGMFIPLRVLDRINELKKSLEVEIPDWIDSKTRRAFEGIANARQLNKIKWEYEHGAFLDDPLAIEYVNHISSKVLRDLKTRAAERDKIASE